MNDTQLLERLGAAYDTLEAPAPSAALAALMDAGGVASHDADDDRRDAVVVPFARPRSRVRMRYLVAALVASFVAVSGLAAAGALPDSLQRQVSSVVSHLGVDLPSPDSSHDNGPADTPPGTNGSGRPSSSTPTTIATPGAGADDPVRGPGAAGTTVPGGAPTTTPAVPSLGDVGAIDGGTPPTTLPSSGGDLGLPPITVPVISLPPISLPPILDPILDPLLPLIPLPLPPLLGL
jgi:hypothetical protein